MQLSRQHLQRRLEQGNKELSSGETFLLVAAVIVGLNILLVIFNLWRGWRTTDYYYLFILLVWIGFYVVQRKIQQRKRAEVNQLENQLQKT